MLQSVYLTVAVGVMVGAPPSKWIEGDADESAGRGVRRSGGSGVRGKKRGRSMLRFRRPNEDDNGWKEHSTCLGNVIGPSIAAAARVGTAMEWVISEGEGSNRRHSGHGPK